MKKNPENIILREALYQFNQITGGKAKRIQGAFPTRGTETEATLRITLGEEHHDFFVEVKHELRQSTLPIVIVKLSKHKENWLLVSKYIPMPLKNQLKKQGINYLEAAGNCFINAGGLFLYINDRPVTASRQTATGKLWKQAGLKFLFVVISNPALLNKSYRTIADAVGIALGNIGPLIKELQQTGHIKKDKEEWILFNKETLLQRWVEFFHILLKPTLQKGRFRFLRPEIQREWKTMNPVNFYWGGEPAGELLTNFLYPELFTIYTSNTATELMKELALVPDAAGNVEMVEQFWNAAPLKNDAISARVVPPLLAYADLMATNDSRNWEVAARIKTKYLND